MKNKLFFLGVAVLSLFTTSKVQSQAPTAAFAFSSAVCASQTVQIVDLSSNSPTAWSYTVSGVGVYTTQNPVITFPSTGIYFITLIATNGIGGSFPHTESVSVNAKPNVTATSPSSICTGDYAALSGNGALTYTWTGGVIDGSAFAPTASGVYTVTGFDANGCYNTATTSITLKPLPTLSITSATSVCIGSAITLTASGANTYTWSGGPVASTYTDSPVVNTTYTVRGTSAVTNCSNSATKTVTVNALPTVTVNSGTLCAGSVFTMNPGGATSYSYSSTSNTVSPVSNQSYTVTGTNANGCSATAVSDVTVYATPPVSVNSGSICSGTTFTMMPSGGVTFSYSSAGNTPTVNPLANTSYSVYSIDANGCKSSTAAISNVTVVAAPILTVNSGSICAGATFTINPTGATNFTYITGASTVAPSSTTSYTIIGSNSSTGCVSPEAVATVTVHALPTVSVNGGTVCAGSIFTITPTGTGANSFVFSSGFNTVTPTSNTSYTVSSISAQGCASAAQAICNVTVYAAPVVSVTSGSICLGSIYTMTATGASTYSYSSGSPSVSPPGNSIVLVTGFGPQGCPSANTATCSITVYTLPVLSVVSATGGVCLGNVATLTVSGANTFTWTADNTNASTFTAVPTANTSYTVKGTDSNGCIGTKVYTVVVNSLPVISVNSGVVCPGGSFTIIPNGAITYTYSSGSAIVTPSSDNTYSVTGTDANGCVSPVAAVSTVNIVNSLTITVSGNTTICEGLSTTLTANGASTYSWNTNAQTNTVNVNPSTTAAYTVTGISGSCTNTLEVSVVVNPAPVITFSSTSDILCIGSTATLTAFGATSYSWLDNAANETLVITPTVTTSYTVTGTGNNSCSSSAVVTQSVQDCTGISEVNGLTSELVLYPNPTKGEFTIQVQHKSSIKVLNGIGQVIYDSMLTAGENNVVLTNQPHGIYFVQIKQAEEIKTIKVIKN